MGSGKYYLTQRVQINSRHYFNRLLFGIISALEIFKCEMTKLLEGKDGVAICMDNIVFYADTPEQHEARLQKTLDRLKETWLRLRNDKCLLH